MALNPSKTFRNPIQIGLIVEDAEKIMKNLQDVLGIGPFRTTTFPPADDDNVSREYRGERGNFAAKFCFFDLGNIEIELIEPTAGDSVWKEYLDKHGTGLHHIKFSVDEHQPVHDYFKGKGIEVSQKGSSVGKNAGKTWVYYDSDAVLGFAVETMNENPAKS